MDITAQHKLSSYFKGKYLVDNPQNVMFKASDITYCAVTLHRPVPVASVLHYLRMLHYFFSF